MLDFGFLYLRDDDVNVTLNPHMGGIDLARLKWMFTDWSYVRRYIPLGWLNFSATYEAAGLDPHPYHAVALALYAVNSGLVFANVLLALRLFTPRGRSGGLTSWESARRPWPRDGGPSTRSGSRRRRGSPETSTASPWRCSSPAWPPT